MFDLSLKASHIFFCHKESILRLLYPVLYAARMDHGKTSLCCIQCKIQRIVAHYPYRGDGHFYSTGTVVCVGEHQIGADPLPGDDIFPWKSCKNPYLLSFLQWACSLIPYPSPQQFIRKAERLCVLHHLIAVRHHTQYLPVRAADVCLISSHQFMTLCINRFLHNVPVKSCKP